MPRPLTEREIDKFFLAIDRAQYAAYKRRSSPVLTLAGTEVCTSGPYVGKLGVPKKRNQQ